MGCFPDTPSVFQLKQSCLSADHQYVSTKLLPLPASLGTHPLGKEIHGWRCCPAPTGCCGCPFAECPVWVISAAPALFSRTWLSTDLLCWSSACGPCNHLSTHCQSDGMDSEGSRQGFGRCLHMSRPHLLCVTVKNEVGPHVSSRGWILQGFFACISHDGGLCVRCCSYLLLNLCLLLLPMSVHVVLLWVSTCVSGTGITVHFKIALNKIVLCQASQHFTSNITLLMIFFFPKKWKLLL